MSDQREEVLNFIKYNGPVLPVQIAKHVNTNILFASAILSELVSRKSLKITSASIGGSPLYYLPGQEERMDERLSKSLSGKEKEAYNLLKEKKVLREKDLEPWQRVAVKSLKDFAVSISVKERENAEIFWKHNLISDEQAKMIVAEIMDDLYKKQEQVQEIVTKINRQEDVLVNGLVAIEEDTIQVSKPQVKQTVLASRENEVSMKKEPMQDTLLPETKIVKQKEPKKEKKEDTRFYGRVLDFIKNNDVEILKEEVVKKDKEIDFVINLPSNFGKLRYLIKAKNKPLINEADVSMAFSEGQMKKMPVILLTNGKLNKKASLLVEQKMQGQLVVKEV